MPDLRFGVEDVVVGPTISRRSILLAGTAAILGARPAASTPTPYPGGQTIKFVVPFPPGGSTDAVGRLVADRLGARWAVTTIIENISGAGTNIGNERVARGATDGSSILVTASPMVANKFLYTRLTYDPVNDLIPLCQIAIVPNLLCARKDLPVADVAALIAYGKANPGKLTYGTTGIGTSTHLSGELFRRMAGIEMLPVHYRGSAPAMNDLLGGNIDLIFDNIGSILPFARAGQVAALGITKLERSELAPEYPTVASTLPGFETTSFAGLMVRTGTQKAICEIIERDGVAICAEPQLRERLAGLGMETVGRNAAEFSSWLEAERAKWGKLIAELNIHIE